MAKKRTGTKTLQEPIEVIETGVPDWKHAAKALAELVAMIEARATHDAVDSEEPAAQEQQQDG